MGRRCIGFVALGISAGTLACCVTSNGTPVNLRNENAIIIWDKDQGMEHFIRQADFQTNAKDFGFIVPTPSVPQLGVVNSEAFRTLANLVPRGPTSASAGGTKRLASASEHVSVIRTERVGDYQATVVKATDGTSMNAWLKKNGYVSRPAMTNWLDYYAKKKWVFTAFKFVAVDPGQSRTKAVRLSFKTDQPRYPYKMPTDTWPAGWRRPMNLYFISADVVESKYVAQNKQWEARKLWSGYLPNSVKGQFVEDVGLKSEDIPDGAVVTIFQNGSNPDGYDHDIYFAAVPSPSPLPWLVTGTVALGLVLAFGRHHPSS